MSAAGWYPDPGGAPGQFRYWDGQSWSSNTSPMPGGPDLEPEPPRGRGVLIAVIATVGLVITAIVVWLILPRSGPNDVQADNNSTRPTVSGWNEQEATKQPEIEVPEGGTLLDCPRGGGQTKQAVASGGWVSSGGLKFREIPGWETDSSTVVLDWVQNLAAQTDTVYDGWFSMSAVGELKFSDGFKDPKLSAFQVMSCFATSSFYQGYTGRNNLLSEPITINGKQGWRLQTEVMVKMARLPQVEGDVVNVAVVDLGRPDALGVYISSATIGDNRRIDLVEAAYGSLGTS